jgi:folate-binding protein YgfZ
VTEDAMTSSACLAARQAVAVMDRSHFGRLLVTGANRLDLLHRITTNDLRSIGPGQGAQTVLLTEKGRIIDDLRLYARGDDYYLITSPGNQARVRERIEKLRMRDDVTLEDVTAITAMFSLVGPLSAGLLESAAGAPRMEEIPLHHHAHLVIDGHALLAARTTDMGGSGFNLIVDAGAAPSVWAALLDRGRTLGVRTLDAQAWEMLRIERGVPAFGRELTDEHNPLEARLDAAISWNKGCYVGQEVVVRLHSRDKVAKLLMGLRLEPGSVPPAGSPIESPGRPGIEAGRLTSVAAAAHLGCVIGLAYVRTECCAAGTRLVIVSEGGRVSAEVSELPFRAPPRP